MRLQNAEPQNAAAPVRWPDAVAFREAVQNPGTALGDAALQQAAVIPDRLGLPLAYSGRFAVVFRLRTGADGDWALRCFTQSANRAERRERYLAIARQLETAPDYFVPFRYLDEGIRVGGAWYPTVAMRWAGGETLGRWVERNRTNPDALLTLCRALTRMLRDLEASGIAHGDWQHDNLLVSPDGAKITLVDYDGTFVGALDGRPPGEMGHPNFQHPARTAQDYGVGMDRFAHLVMQTALAALARAPFLWDAFNDGESLLFKRSDFLDPRRSPVFAAVRARCGGDAALIERLDRLEAVCLSGAGGVFPGEDALRPLPGNVRVETSIQPELPRLRVETHLHHTAQTRPRARGLAGALAAAFIFLSLSSGIANLHSIRESGARRAPSRATQIAPFNFAHVPRYAGPPAVNLQKADLHGADFLQADLRGADLQEADLRGADLTSANFQNADFRGANLRGANLQNTNLAGSWYDKTTQWPFGFDPDEHGAKLVADSGRGNVP